MRVLALFVTGFVALVCASCLSCVSGQTTFTGKISFPESQNITIPLNSTNSELYIKFVASQKVIVIFQNSECMMIDSSAPIEPNSQNFEGSFEAQYFENTFNVTTSTGVVCFTVVNVGQSYLLSLGKIAYSLTIVSKPLDQQLQQVSENVQALSQQIAALSSQVDSIASPEKTRAGLTDREVGIVIGSSIGAVIALFLVFAYVKTRKPDGSPRLADIPLSSSQVAV